MDLPEVQEVRASFIDQTLVHLSNCFTFYKEYDQAIN
jgi:hypothetical protein